MKYAPVINALHAAFGDAARVVTRYNSDEKDARSIKRMLEHPDTVDGGRETKFVVVDFGAVSFKLRVLQIKEGTRTIDPHAMLSSNTYTGCNTLDSAVASSGLSAKYFEALDFIVEEIKKHTGKEPFFGAECHPFNQAVGIFVRQDNMLVMFQFKE